ncbi:MAG: non-canonical purine NTP pyrophosphatase [Candidatus Spechtbacterales bacterium]|nr:non-canonical purine NTP pyrophosphatase [Candidatus Spechtbacterales bacterium]
MIYFVTSNKNKFIEARAILKDVVELEQLDIDLPEIQEADAREIVKEKLIEAQKHHKGKFMVEDTSLELECLGGLPGPFIKWFLEKIGPMGVYGIAKRFDNYKAIARTVVGYSNGDEIYFFEGKVEGKLVEQKVESGFGWDVIFKPDVADVTYAELSKEEKNKISQRSKALTKFKEYLQNL